jgi:glycerophosphoryl diester phosphodiesterase
MNILNTPRIIAHRGCGTLAPENTLEAVAKAADLGIRGVEIDVHVTDDGIPVVHHNTALKDGRRIMDMNSCDLPATVRQLRDILRYCHVRSIWVNVDAKFERRDRETEMAAHMRAMAMGRIIAELMAMYAPKPYAPNMLSSFNNSVLAGAVTVARDRLLIAAIMFKPTASLRTGDPPENIVIPAYLQHATGFEELARDHNVWVWDKEVNKTDANALFRAGVIGIITDRPDLL